MKVSKSQVLLYIHEKLLLEIAEQEVEKNKIFCNLLPNGSI